MTFKIFDDGARKAIADFIIGSPTFSHDRFGSISGTDVPQAVPDRGPYRPDEPQPYCVGSTCSTPPIPTGHPPPTGLHAPLPLMDCIDGIPAQINLQGKSDCPDGYLLKLDQNGIPYCCPMPNTHPGSGKLPSQLGSCGSGYSMTEVSEPHQFTSALLTRCNAAGGDVKYDAAQSRYYCCAPEKQTNELPPSTPQPPAPQYPTDPPPPPAKGLGGIQLARTMVDIPPGKIGLVSLNNMLVGSGASEQTGDPCLETTPQAVALEADVSESGFTSASVCKQTIDSDVPGYRPMKCYNPGGTTIPAGTDIAVGLKAPATKDEFTASIWVALVVPCT